jgi:hypothetical protein
LDIVVVTKGCQVREIVDASGDGNAKFALRSKEGGKLVGVCHGADDGACDSAVLSMDANGAESSEVVRVFVESKEALCCEVWCYFMRNVI